MSQAPVTPLTDEEREHIHQAIEMLGDYEAIQREHGNDSIAAGAGATRYVLTKLFRFLPTRIAGVPVSEPLRHSTKDNGDCPHWCKACAAEERERNAGVNETSDAARQQGNGGV